MENRGVLWAFVKAIAMEWPDIEELDESMLIFMSMSMFMQSKWFELMFAPVRCGPTTV